MTDSVKTPQDVIGNVQLGKNVVVAPIALLRGDEGQPIWIGNDSNLQDGVVLHASETCVKAELVREAVVEVAGKVYGIYVGDRVSLAYNCQIHGPAFIGSDTSIGMQALVFRATVGSNCVVEDRALVMGVNVPAGRYVPAGCVLTSQEAADNLPLLKNRYQYKETDQLELDINIQLTRSIGSLQSPCVRPGLSHC